MQKTLNIAHRGFTKEFPDNTLEAFYAAIRLGVDGIECDVHETADHHFVIFHDSELGGRIITEMSLQEIRNVKISEHYHIPMLEETLDMCHNHIRVMLELKLVHSLDLFLEIVNAKMKTSELFLTSFYPHLINDLADFAPHIPRGILTGFATNDPLKIIELTRARIMLPQFPFANADLINILHSHGVSTILWDCNSAQDFRTAIKWGVDGIITDSPDILTQELSK
ncbi:MAG: glycerophosphodiester phosphodiesterase [Dehalococcoidales bacterium]|nr:glycerophosphodiester phosphodiesterase [Dehalococcoidales bacterium]